MGEQGNERAAKAIRARREALGLTQEEAAQRSDGRVSSANWRVIEGAGRNSYRHSTLVGVARALHWTDDSIERLFAGLEPVDRRIDGVQERLAQREAVLAVTDERLRELELLLPTSTGDEHAALAAKRRDLAAHLAITISEIARLTNTLEALRSGDVRVALFDHAVDEPSPTPSASTPRVVPGNHDLDGRLTQIEATLDRHEKYLDQILAELRAGQG